MLISSSGKVSWPVVRCAKCKNGAENFFFWFIYGLIELVELNQNIYFLLIFDQFSGQKYQKYWKILIRSKSAFFPKKRQNSPLYTVCTGLKPLFSDSASKIEYYYVSLTSFDVVVMAHEVDQDHDIGIWTPLSCKPI
jgi:hypothetical protein